MNHRRNLPDRMCEFPIMFLIVKGQRAAIGIQCELHLNHRPSLHPSILPNCISCVYIRLCPLPPILSYPWRLADSPLPSTQPTLVFPSDPCPSRHPQAHPVSKMDCSCGCLARMEPMMETCVLSEGLVLNHKQRHNALCSLLYSPSIGFRAPFVHKMTQDDVSDAWVCICVYFFMYSLIYFL